jgi:glycosyltransferase involved in cell wall biosynthesis
MVQYKKKWNPENVGIVSFRLAGTDGVSLESEKWAQVMENAGLLCHYFAGQLERPAELSYMVKEAHFRHPDIAALHEKCFGVSERDRSVTHEIHRLAKYLKDHLYRFIEKFDIGLLVPENVLAIPLNIPLAIALTELIAETNIPTVAHHHDFYWERDRFIINAVSDYLHMSYPPELPSIVHTVINSFADEQLSFRTGISARIIPNVMDFDNPPPPLDDYAADVRQALGIKDDELFVLQPTRVVKRKGIEHAIELVHRLGQKAKLVISHASGDEGHDYEQRLREYSRLMKVNTIFVSDIIDEQRGTLPDGRKVYTLQDIYPHADLVTYPSTFEGFGNAFLEAIYFRKPIVVNIYSIYARDIKPKGFSVIEIDGYVTREAVDLTRKVLKDDLLRQQMVNHNYALATGFYSYTVLRTLLRNMITEQPWFAKR